MPSLTQLAPLLLLPLTAWVILDMLDLAPQPGQQPVLVFTRVLQAGGKAVSSMATSGDVEADGVEEADELVLPPLMPPPPPPMQLDYWQKVLVHCGLRCYTYCMYDFASMVLRTWQC